MRRKAKTSVQTVYEDVLLSLVRAALGKGDLIPFPQEISWKTLYNMVKENHLEGMTFGVIQNLIQDSNPMIYAIWKEDWIKAVTREIWFDQERMKFSKKMDEAEIPYVMLKGVRLKTLYPEVGMRFFCDYDILYDSSRKSEIKKIMIEEGYSYKEDDHILNHHDTYLKKPMFNFEFHSSLLPANVTSWSYFERIWERLIRCSTDAFEYQMTEEDFYLFMIAHDQKHWDKAGLGIRSFCDCYLYLSKYQEKLDWDYVDIKLQEMQLSEFEKWFREFSAKLMEGHPLSADEELLKNRIFASGLFGNHAQVLERRIQNVEKKRGKFMWFYYSIRRIVPSKEMMVIQYPFLKKYPILLPFCYPYRLIAILFRPRRILQELKVMKEYKNKRR